LESVPELFVTRARIIATETKIRIQRNHHLYGKEWELAIKEEYDSLMKNGAWELVEAPSGCNIVTCKWVFKAVLEVPRPIPGLEYPFAGDDIASWRCLDQFPGTILHQRVIFLFDGKLPLHLTV
jgi:hypothetical protein